jgi:formylglycine-generating enzyme required for sulfatase activity
MKKIILVLLMIAFFQNNNLANGITISNVSVINNGSNGQLKFDVSWENGWRSSTLNNWDAAWIFAKYKLVEGQWQHIYFTLANNIIPVGFSASQPAGGEGSFLYRSAAGSGTTTITDVRLGIPQNISQGIFDIKVFAIEMVYIPQGQFYLGDGSGPANSPYATSNTYLIPALVDNENVGVNIYDGYGGGQLTTLPAAFPKGYNAFYSMKYELTQAAYRDFLNTLSYTQQLNHTSNVPSSIVGTAALSASNRNYIEIKTPGVAVSNTPAVYGCDANGNNTFDESTDGEWVACNFLNWQDATAYLAWSALRPITEFEYEKMCRGIMPPVIAEYAWGTNTINTTQFALTSAGQTGEVVSNASVTLGNANTNATVPTAPNNGPLRNGILATSTSDRITSGGSFYGVMELTGNLIEKCACPSNVTYGRIFNGVHGNGTLNANGYATLSTWPGYNSSTSSIDGINDEYGIINKGGAFNGFGLLQVSYRPVPPAPAGLTNGRFAQNGCRGGRIAP